VWSSSLTRCLLIVSMANGEAGDDGSLEHVPSRPALLVKQFRRKSS
jgi:hypothetical protein